MTDPDGKEMSRGEELLKVKKVTLMMMRRKMSMTLLTGTFVLQSTKEVWKNSSQKEKLCWKSTESWVTVMTPEIKIVLADVAMTMTMRTMTVVVADTVAAVLEGGEVIQGLLFLEAGNQVKQKGAAVPDLTVMSLLPAVQFSVGMEGIVGIEVVPIIIHLEVVTCSCGGDSLLDAYETFVLPLYYVSYSISSGVSSVPKLCGQKGW